MDELDITKRIPTPVRVHLPLGFRHFVKNMITTEDAFKLVAFRWPLNEEKAKIADDLRSMSGLATMEEAEFAADCLMSSLESCRDACRYVIVWLAADFLCSLKPDECAFWLRPQDRQRFNDIAEDYGIRIPLGHPPIVG